MKYQTRIVLKNVSVFLFLSFHIVNTAAAEITNAASVSKAKSNHDNYGVAVYGTNKVTLSSNIAKNSSTNVLDDLVLNASICAPSRASIVSDTTLIISNEVVGGIDASPESSDYMNDSVRFDASNYNTEFWAEAPLLFNVGHSSLKRQSIYRPSNRIGIDHEIKFTGDFSIVLKLDNPRYKVAGFYFSLWEEEFELSPDVELEGYFRTSSAVSFKNRMELVDVSGQKVSLDFKTEKTDREGWTKFYANNVKVKKGFDFSKVSHAQLLFEMKEDKVKIWLDGVKVISGNQHIGISDKSLNQRVEERNKTIETRRKIGFEYGIKRDKTNASFGGDWVKWFAKLYLNQDLKEVNKGLLESLPEFKERQPWSLFHTPYFIRLYDYFGSTSSYFPNRISPEVEKLLLEVLWDRTYDKNDIQAAKRSTWYLDGSENHDINAKACNLATSRIFMQHSEYKDRIYPNYGFGGSMHYGSGSYRGKELQERKEGGRANWSDGKDYRPADHYKAWVSYFKEYFSERAKRGFFLERSSDGYMKHTLNFVDIVHTHSGDKKLQAITSDFLDLVWTDWAMESVSGNRGGVKKRNKLKVASKAMKSYASYYFGGPGDGQIWWYWALTSSYEMPEIVMALALNRKELGSYEYISRGIGEEPAVLPRPLGLERSLNCDTDSRFVKYSYVTPDYVLGCEMQHPLAVHSHLSTGATWQGMVFSDSPESRIVTVGTAGLSSEEKFKKPDMSIVYRNIQHKSVMITQQARKFMSINPEWYPNTPILDKEIGVYFGKDWDEKIEEKGWVFVRKGNAYAAVRPILFDEEYERASKTDNSGNQKYFYSHLDNPRLKILEDSYTWTSRGEVMALKDKHSPVIIEAGNKTTYGSLKLFMSKILSNRLELYRAVVPGYDYLVYKGAYEGAKEISFNAMNSEIPRLDGTSFNYEYPKLFDSPFMQSKYKSGKIEIRLKDKVETRSF